MRKKKKTKEILLNTAKFLVAFGILLAGIAFIWVSTFDIPDLDGFANRQVQQSTKIYDRTGEIVLYDLNKDVRRTKVPLSDISQNLKDATIAIEDSNFYNHNGIEPTAILRAVWTNLKSLEFEQGGSTITQQVVKNTLLTPQKTISRKLKEWILAIRIDKDLDKDTILEIYLNETPYGGRVYGAEEAADRYFGKTAKDISVAEAAYLAALPQAPTFYWNNREALENRKNKVLREMRAGDFITEDEYQSALVEEVVFLNDADTSIRAPHFVFFIREYLEEVYGSSVIERQGLRVITTLDYELQQEAERILSEYGAANAERFNASNAALVAVDPKTGQILSMVGSREYDNEEIQGNFNAATSPRQPGSSFKPFVYATALDKGYTDSTVVFDLPTQFSAACDADNFTSNTGCFSPVNYDNRFRGPISFRDALAQSVNVPAVKALYLAGIEESLDTAKSMGISTLNRDPGQYGLSLVLGSGEVTLLDLTSAYGVFANQGVKNPHTGILRIEDIEGEIIEEFEEDPEQVLPTNTANLMNDILSDNVARTPSFGSNSPLYFPDYDIAAKTGTTNEYKDLWTVGYGPQIAVGVWSGNNDNTSVNGEVAGYVVAPMWQEFIRFALENSEVSESFAAPENIETANLKPVLRGEWRSDGQPRDRALLPGSDDYRSGDSIHSILHWVSRNNPRGPVPTNPKNDSQYENWEYSVQRWAQGSDFDTVGLNTEIVDITDSTENDTISSGFVELLSTLEDIYSSSTELEILAANNGELDRLELYVNGELVDDDDSQPFVVSVNLDDVSSATGNNNTLTLIGLNNAGEEETITHHFSIDN